MSSLTAALAAPLVALVATQNPQRIELIEREYLVCSDVTPAGVDPIDELNCDEIWFLDAGCRAIIQNDDPDDAKRSAELRDLGKRLFRRAVLIEDGPIRDYYLTGQLYGVELDWFFPGGLTPPTDDYLPVFGDLVYDMYGKDLLTGRIYAYDKAQFDKRRKELENDLGHPLRQFTVWAEELVTTSKGSVKVYGWYNEFHGRFTSTDDILGLGKGNEYYNDLLALGNIVVDESTKSPFEAEAGPETLPVVPFTEDEARALAILTGTWYSGDVLLDGSELPTGVTVFAEGSIYFFGSKLDETWTFVSSDGNVHLGGIQNELSAANSNYLALSFHGDVIVSGYASNLTGALVAPEGRVSVSSMNTMIQGIVHGENVSVWGILNHLTDGTDPSQ